MKVMILAAGKGTRMLPLTEKMPKPLLRAGSRTLIEHQIIKLKDQGFRDLVINHAWLGEQLEQALGNGSKLGVNIRWSSEGEPLETAGGIHKALPLLGDEPFVVVNADVWTDFPYAALRSAKADADLIHLVLVDNPPQHSQGDFCITSGNRLAEKQPGLPTFTYSGIGVFSPALFSALPSGKYPLLPLLVDAIGKGKAGASFHKGIWLDIGTPERLKGLDETLNKENYP